MVETNNVFYKRIFVNLQKRKKHRGQIICDLHNPRGIEREQKKKRKKFKTRSGTNYIYYDIFRNWSTNYA